MGTFNGIASRANPKAKTSKRHSTFETKTLPTLPDVTRKMLWYQDFVTLYARARER